jgi:hypothetical protein
MNRPEQALQRAVFQHFYLRARPGVFAFHPANGGWRSRVEAAILKSLGVRAGVPDAGLKAPGGRLTAIQKAVHDAMRAAGAMVATRRSYSLKRGGSFGAQWAFLALG